MPGVLGDVRDGPSQSLMNLLGVDLVLLVNDAIPESGGGGKATRELDGENR